MELFMQKLKLVDFASTFVLLFHLIRSDPNLFVDVLGSVLVTHLASQFCSLLILSSHQFKSSKFNCVKW